MDILPSLNCISHTHNHDTGRMINRSRVFSSHMQLSSHQSRPPSHRRTCLSAPLSLASLQSCRCHWLARCGSVITCQPGSPDPRDGSCTNRHQTFPTFLVLLDKTDKSRGKARLSTLVGFHKTFKYCG